MTAVVARAIVPLFALALAVPAVVGLLFPADRMLTAENRMAAPAPDLPATLAEAAALPRELESHIADTFGLRAAMIEAWQALRRQVNGAGQSHRVLAGRDGWLFITDLNVVDRSAGRAVSEEAARRVAEAAIEAHALAEAVGARFAALPAPNKHVVHPDKLPPYARGEPGATTELDLTLRLAREAGVPMLDPRAALRAEAAEGRPVYLRGDTHWNAYGAGLAFDMVMEAWGLEALSIRPRERLRGFHERLHDGDLVGMAGLRGSFLDDLPEMDWSGLGERPEGETTEFADRPSQPSYAIDYGREGPVILVIGDSYTRTIFQPFWRHFAGRVHWTHHDQGGYDRSVFERVRPDYVLFSFAERTPFP